MVLYLNGLYGFGVPPPFAESDPGRGELGLHCKLGSSACPQEGDAVAEVVMGHKVHMKKIG